MSAAAGVPQHLTSLNMRRYLLNFSYLGSSFRGLQRQVAVQDGKRRLDPTTIQGQIEIALGKLRSLNEPATVLSSRTDAGVHALCNTLHIDLQSSYGIAYQPKSITSVLNSHFHKNSIPIRVLKTFVVPNDFHCRYKAISRTYLYRIYVTTVTGGKPRATLLNYIPIEEFNRSLCISVETFDISKAREAASLFVGYRDFRTFMHRSTFKPDKITRRTIKSLEIREGQPPWSDSYAWPSCVNSDTSNYKIYDIIITADGFLYRQVRRTVASLVAAAKGIVTPSDIKFMLEIPSHRSWDPRIKTVPAQGLYLCEVAYARNDLETFREDLEK